MSNIIPFEVGNTAVALPSDLADLFENVVGGSAPPHISIKGKVFRIVKDDNETLYADEEGNPLPVLKVVVLDQTKTKDGRPTRCRAFFAASYDGSAQAPACFSNDGVRPSGRSKDAQSLSCETCPKSVKGSKITEKGTSTTACATGKMLAVIPSGDLDYAALSLRLPISAIWSESEPHSAKGWYSWDGYCKFLKSNGIVNPAMVETSIRFDPQEAFPKPIFKVSGRLGEDMLRKVAERRKETEVVDIIGVNEPYAEKVGVKEPAKPNDDFEDTTVGLGDLPVVESKPTAKVADDFDDAPKPAKKESKPKPATKEKPVVVESDSELQNLLSDW